MKCKQCGSENCREQEAYWSTGSQLVKVIYCEDCQEFSDK